MKKLYFRNLSRPPLPHGENMCGLIGYQAKPHLYSRIRMTALNFSCHGYVFQQNHGSILLEAVYDL